MASGFGRGRGRERRERDKRLRALAPPCGHTLGYIGGGVTKSVSGTAVDVGGCTPAVLVVAAPGFRDSGLGLRVEGVE